ncbi:MAG: hypothetical protein EBT09_01465, partial [Actinobacteria bacterium]|nr:hypothetical protein [Actinomycetota bacterium]
MGFIFLSLLFVMATTSVAEQQAPSGGPAQTTSTAQDGGNLPAAIDAPTAEPPQPTSPAALASTFVTLLLGWWTMRHQSNRQHDPEATPAGDSEAFTDFLDLFFGPMVEDGKLASHEFAPL